MIEVAKILTTHNDDKFVVNLSNVRIITGMSNAGWEKDMIDKAPECFKDKIFHHGKLSRADLMSIKNGLIIIDEIDTGDKEYQVLHTTLKEAGILDVNHMIQNNNRFVFISATMIRELYDLYRWGDLHELYTMTIPSSYIGHKDFLDMGIIKEFYPLNTDDNSNKWVQEDIINYYGNSDPRVHIVRVNTKTVGFVQNACIRNGVDFRNHTSTDKLSEDEISEFFKEPLTKHIVLAVKGFFRRANLIPNNWKLRIGATHEFYTKKVDNNVQIQGLPGRMAGYWRDIIEAGHKTGPYRTSIKAVEEYENTYNDPFGSNSYQTTGFNKKNGKISSKTTTMLSAKHIKNLDPVDISDIETETDEHPDYDITELYNSLEEIKEYMKSIINIGKITTYKNTDSNIQYRGITTPLYIYESYDEFKKSDIYWGINKEAKNESIVCRIMPVFHSYSSDVKWIGIYLKSAKL
jgi:hypothetical protein